ncbi:MAG: hypothetical protein GC179_15360 [Anaerolineaceae bacterium]|nr:hypothetical protein [Anaerolineaceae bacterium]
MDYIQFKFDTPGGKPLYRALPATVMHPRLTPQLTKQSFNALTKQKMVSTPSLIKGHAGTDLWYAGSKPDHFYVLQIKFEGNFFTKKPDVYYRSLCTFTPEFGTDMVDGWFCADIEEYVLSEMFNYPSKRLAIFDQRDSVPIEDYLRSRGFPLSPTSDNIT